MMKDRHPNRTPDELAQEFGYMENLLETLGRTLIKEEVRFQAAKNAEEFVHMISIDRHIDYYSDIRQIPIPDSWRIMTCSIVDDEEQTYPEGYDEMLAATIAKKLEIRDVRTSAESGIVTFVYQLPTEEEQNG